MFALTIDTAWFTNLDSTTWIVIAGLGVLWGSKLVPAGLLEKVKGWLHIDESPYPPSPDVVDDMPILIHQMRLLACDDTPAVRDGINKHLDEIEQLISGTEIDAT
jgi:hypothetical protein